MKILSYGVCVLFATTIVLFLGEAEGLSCSCSKASPTTCSVSSDNCGQQHAAICTSDPGGATCSCACSNCKASSFGLKGPLGTDHAAVPIASDAALLHHVMDVLASHAAEVKRVEQAWNEDIARLQRMAEDEEVLQKSSDASTNAACSQDSSPSSRASSPMDSNSNSLSSCNSCIWRGKEFSQNACIQDLANWFRCCGNGKWSGPALNCPAPC